MTATLTPKPQAPELPALPAASRAHWWVVAPTVFAALNAIAFLVVRPDVNDLWAARARESAVNHGVGLFYWFGWFGGGSTPGNYSVITPYLSSWIGTETVGALAAVVATALATVLVRRTRRPLSAAAVAAVAISINLWSGRVPFLLGSAVGIGALIAVRDRRRVRTAALTLLSIAASPVAGAFVAVGLSGTFLCTRTRAYRPVILVAVGTTFAAIAAVAVLFGAPGPEPFPLTLLVELTAALALQFLARPPDHLRITLRVAMLACVVLIAIPNGMGSNFSRFVWFCIPVAVIAMGTASRARVALAVVPLLFGGALGTLTDLQNASRPISSTGYYSSLADRLDQIPDLDNYRVEVVNHGAHAGYDALLSHASLARGWETQEDLALNKSLNEDPLSRVTYKVWLDNNAVGYVALPSASVGGDYPEYSLVAKRGAPYLVRVWNNADWQLFRVNNPSPIVADPARIVAHTQSSMTIDVPCACEINVRVRWSKFLSAPFRPVPPGAAVLRALSTDARVVDDGSGWTTVITSHSGQYTLRGSIGGLLR